MSLPVRLVVLLLAGAPLLPYAPLVSVAQAAPLVPVALPPGQKVDDWTDSLAARGLAVSRIQGLPMSGPGVSLVDRKDYWEMTVRDWKGGTQTVNVAPCASQEEREDLLFYASTLLGAAPPEPVVVATAPPPPPPTTTAPATPAPATTTPAPATAKAPATTPPATTSKAPATPATTTAPVTTTAPATTPPATSTPASTTTTRPATKSGLWVAVGGGVGIRSAAGAVADFHADGGWYLTRDVRIGLGLGARSAASLLEAGDGRTMGDVDLLVEGAWGLPLAPVTPYLGVYTGVAIRSFADLGEPVLTAPVPLLGGEVGANIPLGQLPLQVAPNVRVQGDLRSIELRSAGGLTPISPVEIRAGVALVYRPG